MSGWASTNCSKILNVKTIFNTVKNFRENSVFRASASCSKFWMIKNTSSIQWIQGTLFFRASKSCSNILNVKSILNTVKNFITNSFQSKRKVPQKSWQIKNISTQWKISGKTLFFRASACCSKFWMIKNIYSIQWIQGKLCFSGQAQVSQKSWKIKNISTQCQRSQC